MNSAGASRPRSGWLPAHQRLDAGDLAAGAGRRSAGSGASSSLALERVAQLALDLEPAQRAARISASKSSQRARPCSLARYMAASASRTAGRRRPARGRGPGDGDADAGGDEVLAPVDREGLGEGGGDALGDRHRLVLVGEAVDQDPELVAAEAGDGVARAQVGAQPRRHRPQQLVAGVVAEAVVDQLEAVEVEEEDPDRRAGAVRASQRVAERVDEAEPVGQAGERVVEDAVAQRLVGGVALDRVGEHVGRGLHEVDVLRREAAGLGGVDVEHPERAALCRRSRRRGCCRPRAPAAPAAS